MEERERENEREIKGERKEGSEGERKKKKKKEKILEKLVWSLPPIFNGLLQGVSFSRRQLFLCYSSIIGHKLT